MRPAVSAVVCVWAPHALPYLPPVSDLPADAAGGEEVSEPTMYRRCYAGHLNLGGGGEMAAASAASLPLAPQIALMGAHSGACPASLEQQCSVTIACSICLTSCWWHACVRHLRVVLIGPAAFPRAELLVSPSYDGNLFIWHYGSGHLAAVLPAAPAAAPVSSARPGSSGGGGGGVAAAYGAPVATVCVAPHPLLPVLASGCTDSIVRLWYPEGEQQCNVQHAAATVHANLGRLAAGGMQQITDGVFLIGGGGNVVPLALRGP